MSQEALAEKLGVSRQTVISIEQGRYNPSLPLAIKIADLFNVIDLREIFYGDNDAPHNSVGKRRG